MPSVEEPRIYLTGGTDELLLGEDPHVYRTGDAMPPTLTDEARVSLRAAGIVFETRHPEATAPTTVTVPSDTSQTSPTSPTSPSETPPAAAKE